MKLFAPLLLAAAIFAIAGCEKTIHEARTPVAPAQSLALAQR